MNKKESFEEFLQEKHSENYIGTDDDMPDAYDNWLTDLQADDFIEAAKEWHAQELEKFNLN